MTVKDILETLDYGPAPEAASAAFDWIAEHGPEFKLYIGGEWKAASSGGTIAVENPATGESLGAIPKATSEDIDEAVACAKAAFPSWSVLPGPERAKFLYAIAREIQKHSRLFAVLETMDNGKPIRETRDIDIPLVARHFYYHAGWASLAETELADFEPVGVCGQIIPWNFPLLMLSWKIAPAIAAGNTVVLKAAELTSLTALAFADLCDRVGLPKGVVNIVTGDGETGAAIVNHPDVNKIAFTGSTEVGRILRKATAGTGKKLSLELGGKSPYIIFEDADLDSAVEGLVDAIWFNQGQVCCAGSRLLVQEGVADQVFRRIRERMSNLRIGDPLDKAVDVGAIVSSEQLCRIRDLVDAGVAGGAEIHQTSCDLPAKGHYYPPTLLTNVGPSDRVVQEEIFGPVLVAMTFRNPAEAVELANNTVYGLAACIWSENLNLAHDVASKIKAGTVWVNCTNQFDAASGFGGYRESGYGREGGLEGMMGYLKPRATDERQSTQKSDQAEPPVESDVLDRTHKMYIGGKQARGDSGYALSYGSYEVSRGNRKDIRNAVEAGFGAEKKWATSTGHLRAQILYYLAENMGAERETFIRAIMAGGVGKPAAEAEFDASIRRIMHYAAWADKFDGQVHSAPINGMVFAVNEPLGNTACVAPDEVPLLGLLSVVLPLVALGNVVTVVPSETNPLPACELYRVLDCSDLPAGVVNIVTGLRSELVPTLADHDNLAALWHFGSATEGAEVERRSVGNLKQTWCTLGQAVDWFQTPGKEWLRRATQVKNVWVPHGW